jgi:hypothetical protein
MPQNTVNMMRTRRLEIDFVADDPAPSQLRRHTKTVGARMRITRRGLCALVSPMRSIVDEFA